MKWLKRILLGLLGLVLLALGVLYAWSGFIIGKEYTAQPRTVEISANPEIIEEGERLAQVYGCFHGCHGADMEGDYFFDDPLLGSFYAANLTWAVEHYSPVELEGLIRQGIRPNGNSLLGMPSDSFSIMTDHDLAAILSFISAYPRQVDDPGKTRVGPLGRLGLVLGEYWPAAAKPRPGPWQEGFRDDPMKLGEYIATMTCTECHGMELEGTEGFTPPLAMVDAYSLDDFRKLMSTGLGLADRDLGLMTRMAEFRLKHMTDEEVVALHAYLQSL